MRKTRKPERSCLTRMLAHIASLLGHMTLISFFPLIARAQGSALDTASGSPGLPGAGACNSGDYACLAKDADDPAGASDSGPDTGEKGDWVNKWFRAVDRARSEEPHCVAPLVTTHVLLVQQYRFDSSWQTNSNGTATDNYGNGHGLEIIPNSRMEVQIAQPPYLVHTGSTPDGFGDVSLFIKFRAFSKPEGEGDYFVGVFFGASFPSASPPNGAGHTILSPMLALAKGWGPFSIQNTFSGNLPASGTNVLGRAFVWNTTFQYGIKRIVWPEVEQNSTFFSDGPDSGKKETFLTPGVIFGPFHLAGRLHFVTGGGLQIAATHFHTYDHRWIWSVRFPF